MKESRKGNLYLYYKGRIVQSGLERHTYVALLIWPQILGGKRSIVQRYAIETSESGMIIDFWLCRSNWKSCTEFGGKLVKAVNWVATDRQEAKELCQSWIHRHLAERQREKGEEDSWVGLRKLK